MNKTIIALTLASVMASTSSFAAEAEPEYQASKQDAGLGIGLLAGAIVGGPIGFIVGGLIGAQTGQAEDYKQQLVEKDQQLASLRKDITLAQAAKSTTTVNTDTQPQQSFHHTAIASNKLNSTLATGMRVDVLFRTNSKNIEPHYTSQLQRVVAVMKLFPEVEVQLAGHADPRGPETDNLTLSKRRINSIRQTLVKSGITNTRIHATAWGERNTISSERDIEAYAFDRRVVIDFVSRSSGDDKAALRQSTDRHPDSLIATSLQQ